MALTANQNKFAPFLMLEYLHGDIKRFEQLWVFLTETQREQVFNYLINNLNDEDNDEITRRTDSINERNSI